MTWVSVNDKLPANPGNISEPVLVCAREFGQRPRLAVARCWLSIAPNAEPVWYFDNMFYGDNSPFQIAEPVTHWMMIPEMPTDMRGEKINLSQSQIDGLTTDLIRIPGRDKE